MSDPVIEEQPVAKTDNDSNRLLARVIDKVDAVLFAQGFAFREEMAWENMIEELREMIFKYYDDLTGGDEDYDPNAAPDSSDSGESMSESLNGDSAE